MGCGLKVMSSRMAGDPTPTHFLGPEGGNNSEIASYSVTIHGVTLTSAQPLRGRALRVAVGGKVLWAFPLTRN